MFTNIVVDAAGHYLLEGLTIVTFADEDRKLTLRTQAKAVAAN